MKFWDASDIVPLLITETTTRAAQIVAAKDAAMLVWWATEVVRLGGCPAGTRARLRSGARGVPALKLAAAFIAAERRPSSVEVLTLDDRLAAAARKEGFVVIEVPSAE